MVAENLIMRSLESLYVEQIRSIRTTEKRPLALYDLDGTYFWGSMLEKIVSSLETLQLLCAKDIARLDELRNYIHNNTQETYTEYITGLVTVFMATMAGRHYSLLDRIVDEATRDEIKTRRFARESIDLLAASHHNVIASASLREVTLRFMSNLLSRSQGIDLGDNNLHFGSMWELDESSGLYAGNGKTIDKALLIELLYDDGRFLEDGSVSMGDSPSDLRAMLKTEHRFMIGGGSRMVDPGIRDCHLITDGRDFIHHTLPRSDWSTELPVIQYLNQTTRMILGRTALASQA